MNTLSTTLAAHGTVLLRLEYVMRHVAYMSDGKILRDGGDGWELWKKVKPGCNIEDNALKAKESYNNPCAEFADRAAWRKAMVENFDLELRQKVATVIELMPDDPDGVWSSLDDDGDNPDIETVCELCRLYKAASHEAGNNQPVPERSGP